MSQWERNIQEYLGLPHSQTLHSQLSRVQVCQLGHQSQPEGWQYRIPRPARANFVNPQTVFLPWFFLYPYMQAEMLMRSARHAKQHKWEADLGHSTQCWLSKSSSKSPKDK